MKRDISAENTKELETLHKNLKLLREVNGLSIKKLSEISGISPERLTAIESGKNFEVSHLVTLCSIYHLKPHEIFYKI